MSFTTPSRSARLNVPRLILWAASLVLVVGGVLLMLWSNGKEAAIYVKGTADYPALFASQSGSTVGGYLIAAGVIGALLGLVSLAITWPAVAAPAPDVAALVSPEFDADLDDADLDDDDLDDTAEGAPTDDDLDAAAQADAETQLAAEKATGTGTTKSI